MCHKTTFTWFYFRAFHERSTLASNLPLLVSFDAFLQYVSLLFFTHPKDSDHVWKYSRQKTCKTCFVKQAKLSVRQQQYAVYFTFCISISVIKEHSSDLAMRFRKVVGLPRDRLSKREAEISWPLVGPLRVKNQKHWILHFPWCNDWLVNLHVFQTLRPQFGTQALCSLQAETLKWSDLSNFLRLDRAPPEPQKTLNC